ncbi:MAG TPA: helix-turn-helix domain-containing GNAT family N-acetyltransferase [Rubrivivax sp.]|nr:helix-turn-helix domain-containing GNAT family N-acetyltransferase [Rubrivivax sp.]
MSTLEARVAALREFNRFYTRRIGVLHEGLLETQFSLAESRLLWELAHAGETTASALARTLDLDAGYLSRLLRGFRQRGLLKASRSKADARRTQLSISAAGRRAFAPLDRRSQQQVSALLAPLGEAQQQALLAAMAQIETLLGGRARTSAFMLRSPRPGDIGWVVSRHGALYAQEYGWDMRFEALVAHIAAGFVEDFDARHEACWIAERAGQRIGSVFLVQARDGDTQAVEPGTAQLRMLLVEPCARGLGLGVALVNECERFARQAGYKRIRLWTHSLLLAARGIYLKAGYRLVAREAHHSFGHDLVGETWELGLH